MQNKIDSVLNSESKADAMLVEARDEGEKLLLSTRKSIDEEREALAEEISKKKNSTFEAAVKAAELKVAELKDKEKDQAQAIKEAGKGGLKGAAEVILSALMNLGSVE